MTLDPTATPEFQSYLRARDAVRRMQQRTAPPSAAPSAYWTEELENIDYLAEASPLIVRKLRHHAAHITGVRPYDYKDKHDGRRELFQARLEDLHALGGKPLFVPESPALGGFGYSCDGQLVNIDTLKFYEVLVGMERSGVLDAIRAADRPVVCEIGAGWGGFAYQFKTLFPRTTYVIVDFPELFLFSATYLGALFPGARMLFVDGAEGATIDGWREADFVFVPQSLASLAFTLPLDLMVNMASFQEMTESQVRSYAAMATSAGCPTVYSMNRERSYYNTELVSVSEVLSEWYRLTEVRLLETDYVTAAKRRPKKVENEDRTGQYRHMVGHLAAAGRIPKAAEGTGAAAPSTAAPRVVLGMTLHNNAEHLPDALGSLLAQTYSGFALLLLDDASTDGTEDIARRYVERDARVRYARHAERQAMIATWREVAETAAREWPSAEYFAWVSDHDVWHPRWLERLVAELDADPGAVLAYPITRRTSPDGTDIDKGPRLFDTADYPDLQSRWRYYCREVVGSGDMVYGLIRMAALRRAGVFRPVLRPDRLLVAELTLQGRIRQVPEVLWFRRQSRLASVDRQGTSLMLPGTRPRWFLWPPWLQHALVLWREYAAREPRPLPLTRWQWAGMLYRYQVSYGWRHFRKTSASHAIGRAIGRIVFAKKLAKHHFHHAVFHTLVGARVVRGKLKRLVRRAIYEVLVLTHRAGLRGRGEHPLR